MRRPHPRSTFPWWLSVPGIVLVLLVAAGFAQAHPYWTLLLIALSIVGYVVFLRLLVKAPRGEDPEE